MKTVKKTTFRVGDRVVVNRSYNEGNAVLMFLHDHGEGPFLVSKVESVPNICNCGAELDSPEHQIMGLRKRCVPLNELVDHHQWLRLTDVEGKPFGWKVSGALLKASS